MDNLSKTCGKLTMPLLVLLAISFSAFPAQAKYGGGTGEPNNPYMIYDANQMNAIGADSNDWDKHFKLVADINLADYTGTQFNIIGYYESLNSPNNLPFYGVFDGNGHTISNFTYTIADTDSVGLFRYINGVDAEIKDLTLIDPNVKAGGDSRSVACLVGQLLAGTLSGCSIEGASVSGRRFRVAGLVGINYAYGRISNCYFSGSVSGHMSTGGLVGVNSGTISNCYVAGSISSSLDYIGGLVGANYSGGTIEDCYATASVWARGWGGVVGSWDVVGGLVGGNGGTIENSYATGSVSGGGLVAGLVGSNAGTITNCYATGTVSGFDLVGGLVGDNWNGAISNCYATGSVSAGWYAVGGLVGYNSERGTIENCYATGSVSGHGWGRVDEVGGLVGRNGYWYDPPDKPPVVRPAYIFNSYSTGSVQGGEFVGGLVGRHVSGDISACFWDIETSRQSTSAGGEGKTTAQMQTESTFTDTGWDFVSETANGIEDIWDICERTNYPKLVWQIPLLGDFVCPDGVDMRDFAILGAQWRQPPAEPSADIAPDGGDGIVDWFDLAVLAENWLAGV